MCPLTLPSPSNTFVINKQLSGLGKVHMQKSTLFGGGGGVRGEGVSLILTASSVHIPRLFCRARKKKKFQPSRAGWAASGQASNFAHCIGQLAKPHLNPILNLASWISGLFPTPTYMYKVYKFVGATTEYRATKVHLVGTL